MLSLYTLAKENDVTKEAWYSSITLEGRFKKKKKLPNPWPGHFGIREIIPTSDYTYVVRFVTVLGKSVGRKGKKADHVT